MALDTVTLNGTILAPVTNTPASGTVTFKILQELRDNADNVVYSPQTFTATLDLTGKFTLVLPVTDDPDVTPLNWTYWVYVDTDIWNSGVFYLPMPTAMGPIVEFADLLPLGQSTDSCTPDGTPCAPIGAIGALQAEIDALDAEVVSLQDAVTDLTADIVELQNDLASLETDVDAVEAAVLAIQGQIATINGQITVINGQITTLQGQVATNTANIATNTGNITTNTANITTLQGQVATLQGQVATLQGQILNINAAWITTGTLAYQRLGGTIAETDTVVFNRATLVNPGTAADTWHFRYNNVRVLYANEYACLRVRGVPDDQVPARFMSNAARDGLVTAILQASLSNASSHLFQVLGNGDILGPGGASMLPTAPVAVAFTGNMGNAALINDGNVANTGAPYAATTTLEAANNRVTLDGNIANNGGVSIPAQTTLFTVTAAHAPTRWVQFTSRTSGNLAVRLTIKGASGICVADQPMAAGTTMNLDGFNYRKS